MCSHTASRNQRSWVTARSAPDAPGRAKRAFRCAASQATPSTSRWLVGSSRHTMSAAAASTRASATRRRCPPDRVPTRAAGSMSARRPAWISRTAGSEAHSYSSKPGCTASTTVSSGLRVSAWVRTATRTPSRRVTTPPSGSWVPATMRRSVDFPAPLGPRMPTRLPSSRPTVTPSRSLRDPARAPTFCVPSRCAIRWPPSIRCGRRARARGWGSRARPWARRSGHPRGSGHARRRARGLRRSGRTQTA